MQQIHSEGVSKPQIASYQASGDIMRFPKLQLQPTKCGPAMPPAPTTSIWQRSPQVSHSVATSLHSLNSTLFTCRILPGATQMALHSSTGMNIAKVLWCSTGMNIAKVLCCRGETDKKDWNLRRIISSNLFCYPYFILWMPVYSYTKYTMHAYWSWKAMEPVVSRPIRWW